MSYFNSLHCTLGFFGVVKRALGMLTFLKCGRAFSVSGSSAFVPELACWYLYSNHLLLEDDSSTALCLLTALNIAQRLLLP